MDIILSSLLFNEKNIYIIIYIQKLKENYESYLNLAPILSGFLL